MPYKVSIVIKLPRLKPQEAETLLLNAGFELIRTRGSHKIYKKGNKRKVKDLGQLSLLSV